jgi:hypothetical protein
MMLEELSLLFAETSDEAKRADYAAAIIESNCLSKPTASTRRLTNQRLGELYGLDSSIALFRILRKLWGLDASGRPLLALLAALARDPLLAVTCPTIFGLSIGSELQRDTLKNDIRTFVGERLNESSLDKVCRNTASSWTQSGHLEGHSLKKRRAVSATPGCTAFALYLAYAAGFRGTAIFSSLWLNILDCTPHRARELALEAKRLGLLDIRMMDDIVDINLARLDPVSSVS